MKISFSELERNFVMTDKVKRICQPLQQLNIPFFRYMRRYHAGYRFMLSTYADVVGYLYQDKVLPLLYDDGQNIESYHADYWNFADEISKGQLSPEQKLLLADLDRRFSLSKGLSVYRYNETYMEVFCFASADPMLYTMPYNVFNHFSYYFKSEAVDLINKASGNAIMLPQLDKVGNTNENLAKSISNFINETPIKRFYFTINNQDIYLTKQEVVCLKMRYQGLPTKLIAAELGNSQKTIERHFEHLRQKLGNFYRPSLIKSIDNLFLD